VVNQANKIQAQLSQLHPNPHVPMTPEQSAQYQQLQSQLQTLQSSPDYAVNNYWPQLGSMAQGIQWLPQAASQYNDLVSRVQGDVSPLSKMEVPTFTPAGRVQPGVTNPLPVGTALTPALPEYLMAQGGANAINNITNTPVGNLALNNAFMGPASLVIPQNVMDTIGKDIGSGLNSVGNFLGGLF